MKREGYQHGMVRAYRILPNPLNSRPETRYVNRFDSPATAGTFTRVQTKPTNHSKFTGKCGQPRCNGCHFSPASKAKDKTKGHQKSKSTDVSSNHRLLTWRVVDSRPGFVLPGLGSASGILDQLDHFDHDHDHDYDYDDEHLTVDNSNNGGDDDIREEHIGFVVVEEYDNWLLV